MVEYFETTILFDRKLPTYKWLSEKGIQPSNSTCYSLSDLQAALTEAYGATPYIGCSGPQYNATEKGSGSADSGKTVISEVWYFSHVGVGRVSCMKASANENRRCMDGRRMAIRLR